MKFWGLLLVVLSVVLVTPKAHSQIVTIPIPGSPLSLNVMANPQPLQNIYNNPSAVPYQLWDDGYANVPLGFTFPFFDQAFTNSTMYSNGAVQFGPPLTGFPSNNTFCCSGITIDRNTPSAYNYSILMMQDDLYGATGNNHYSLGTSNTMTYGWYNVERLGMPQNKTSFELKIDSTGGIDMRWTGALLSYSSPAIGVIGDASKGEFAVLQQGGLSANTFSIPGLTQWTTGQTPDIIIDPCTTNPLYAPSCAGYQAAYTEQQCSINPLYSTTCSGYQAAYTQQQCSINPLYSMTCSGYQQAYHSQQCSINPLYSTDCPGYAAAYLNQQCSINALYSTTCTGYAEAYKAQQCALDGLYDRTCPNYADAYARKYVIGIPSSGTISYGPADSRCTVGCDTSNTLNTNAGPATLGYSGPGATNVSTTQPVTSISNSGQISTGVAVTNDSNVNSVIATPKMDGPAASTGNSPVASSMNSPGPAASGSSTQTANVGPATRQEQKSEDKRDDAPKGSGGGNSSQNTNNTQASSDKPAAPTARQALQERREAVAKAEAVEKGKNLANEMGKASDLEAQKAVQNVVIQAMGFTPGFDAYSKQLIVQQQFYKPYQVYGNQKTIDNRANLRMFGGTDKLHNEMVESQYNKGN